MSTAANKAAYLIQSRLDSYDTWYTEAKSSRLGLATVKAAKIREEYNGRYVEMRVVAIENNEVVWARW